jgi:hypothetical protein
VFRSIRDRYLTHLRRKTADDLFIYTSFFSAEASFMHRHDSPWQDAWGLNRGLIEDGFSGAGVFTPNGGLVAVIVGSVTMLPLSQVMRNIPFQLPVIVSLHAVASQIKAAMKQANGTKGQQPGG